MEEIKVGDFVRTYQGDIGKAQTVTSTGIIIEDERHIHFDRVIKRSPNIIDLIECGDYVNGYKVRAVYLEGERHYIKLTGLEHARIYDDDIKSVVTHESFNSIKYEVI